MLVTDAVATIKRQFADELGILVDDVDIFSYIHDAELDIIRQVGGNLQSVATTQVKNFPLAVPDNVTVRRVIVGNVALVPTNTESMDLRGLDDTQTGAPQFWFKRGTNICLWPIDTTDTRTATVYYNKVPALMTGTPAANTFTVPEVYHEDVIKYCLARCHNKNMDMNQEKIHMDLYDRSVASRRHEYYDPDAPLYKGGDPMDQY